MPVPATTGQLKLKILDMEIGDYIMSSWDSFNGGRIGNYGYSECPLTGYANPNSTPYFFYYVKVDNGLLIADRVVLHSLSWNTINSWREIEGHSYTLDGIVGKFRSLTGGNTYADESGKSASNDKKSGAFPANNEWDKYIVKFPIEKIEVGKTLDDIFHGNIGKGNPWTWVQETPVNGIIRSDGNTTMSKSTSRIARALGNSYISWTDSSGVATMTGFRPVFEYKEGT